MGLLWFLCGNEKTPSSRIHGIKVHDKLVSLGYSSQIVHKAPRYMEDLYYPDGIINLTSRAISRHDTVVFQKVNGRRTIKLLKKLKPRGIRTVFIDCDLPIKMEMALLADVTICPSKELVRMYNEAGISNVVHIDDAVESFLPPVSAEKAKRTILWFGKSAKGKWDVLDWFKSNVLPSVNDAWEFVTLSDHKDATFRWDAATAPGIINRADLVIIPVSGNDYDQVKSANRCTQSMALGVPVLCNFTTSYREVVIDNYNGLVSNDKDEWIAFIRKLEGNDVINTMKSNAFESTQKFSMDNLISQWIRCFQIDKGSKSNVYLMLISKIMSYYYSVKKNTARIKKELFR